MSRQVLVVRGGALSRSTGLGRAHHDLVDRLGQDLVAGYMVQHLLFYGFDSTLEELNQ